MVMMLQAKLGLGTVAYAIVIGPLIQAMLPAFDRPARAAVPEGAAAST